MRGRQSEAGWAAGAAALATAVAIQVVGLGTSGWRRPLDLTQDANAHAMAIKAVVDHGWALDNPSLGAPFAQHLHDFPFTDNLSLLLVRVLALFTSDWALVMNAYFVLTFPLVALTAYAVARRFGVARPIAAAVGALYALAPYHFLRGEQHLFLSNYLVVPLAIGLVLGTLQGQGITRREGARLGGWATGETIATLGVAALVASSVQYYVLFATLLLAVAAVAQAARERTWRAGVPGAALTAWVVGVFVLNLAPNLAYRLAHGPNPDVAHRTLAETALFSFRVVDLLLPMPAHRLAPFRHLHDTAAAAFGAAPEFGAPALGTVGAVGLLLLLVVAALGLADRRWGRSTDRHLALLAVVGILFGSTGGLNALLAATTGLPLRAWNRLSIFLAFLALLALGRAASRGLAALPRPARPLALVLAALVTAFGIYDQTSPAFRPDPAALAKTWTNDADFVARIERLLPAGAAVLQVPYLAFPEHGPYRQMLDYDPVRGYLHSSTLRWSYGAMRNRPEDIGVGLRQLPGDSLAATALALGYDGVWLDRHGLGGEGSAVERDLRALVPGDPLVSGDARFVFVDLRPLRPRFDAAAPAAARRSLRRHAEAPATFAFGAGFFQPEGDFDRSWIWMPARADLVVDNPLDTTRDVVLTAEVETAGNEPATLLVAGRPTAVTGRGETVEATIRLRPGRNHVELRTTVPFQASGDPRDLRLRFFDLRLIDRAVRSSGDLVR